jgi:hypothetical protein
MTGLELITEFKKKGYVLFLSSEKIGYHYAGVGEPDRFGVIPMLEELRQKKEEVRELLVSQNIKPQDLEKYVELFRLDTAKLAALDPQGIALRQIQQDSPEIWAEIQAAEDEVNELWLKVQKGQMVWQEYLLAVKKWAVKLALAIKERKPQTNLGLSNIGAKGEVEP